MENIISWIYPIILIVILFSVMGFRIKDILIPKKVKSLISKIENADTKFDYNWQYHKISRIAKKYVIKNYKEISKYLNEKNSDEKLLFLIVAKISQDYLLNENLHLNRGVMNPLLGGNDIQRIFKISVNNLVELGVITEEEKKNKLGKIGDYIKYNG